MLSTRVLSHRQEKPGFAVKQRSNLEKAIGVHTTDKKMGDPT